MRPAGASGAFGAQETIWAAVGVLRAWIEQLRDSAGALHGLEKCVCARAECRGAGDGRRAVDAIRPHVRGAGHHDHSGELAAGQGADRAQSRDASGSAGEEAAAARHCRRRGGQCVSRDRTYWADHNRRFAQAPASADDFHVGACPRACAWTRSSGSRRQRTVSNDWVVRYRQSAASSSSGRVGGRRRGARCWSTRTWTAQIEIRYRDRVMRWTEIAAAGARPRRDAGATAARRPGRRPPALAGRAAGAIIRGASGRGVSRRPATGRRIGERGRGAAVRPPVEAAGAVDAKSTRPPLLGKLQNSFPQLPQAHHLKGTFLTS